MERKIKPSVTTFKDGVWRPRNADKRSREGVHCRAAEILHINSFTFENLGLHGVFFNTIEFKCTIIKNSGIFNGVDLPPGFIEDAAKASKFKSYNRNDIIVKQGRRTNSIYFLIRGICKVVQKGDKVEEYVIKKGNWSRNAPI